MTRDFLFTSFEGGGNVPPLVGAVRRLVARGHRVRVLGDDTMRAEVEQAGAAFVPWRTPFNRTDRGAADDPMKDWEATEPGGGLLRVLDLLMIGPAADYAADTLAELRRAPADLVVACDLLFGPMMAAEATGTPFAVLSANISLFPMPGMPPVGPGLAPPATADERAMAEGAAAWFGAALAERLPALNAARAGIGLAPLAEALDQPRAAALHLLATSRAFDFPVPSLPDRVRYVGPLLDQPAWAGDWSSPWPADDPRPLVLVAMSSTFQNQEGAIRRVLQAASGLDVRVLVTLGPGLAGTAGLGGFANAAIIDRAPHDAVMPQAAVVVTHCGHGTVMRALSHGRPMLCLPMGRDQNDNAARVAWHGAGLRLPPDAPAASLRGALIELLESDRYTAAAAALGQAIRQSEPRDALADTLEAVARGGACRQAA